MFSITSRDWRAGSFTTSLIELIIITLRSAAEYADQRAKPLEFGFPVAANAAHAPLTRFGNWKDIGRTARELLYERIAYVIEDERYFDRVW